MPEPDDEGLTPEQQEQIQRALAQARTAIGRLTVGGVLAGIGRGAVRRLTPRIRFSRKKIAAFFIGLGIVALSVVTCSAGVDLAKLTAEYGEPVPATTDAARRFIERSTAAMRSVPSTSRFRMTVSEGEATSALSLGLMMPELMRAMETVPAERVQQAADIEELRAVLREEEESRRAQRTFWQRVVGVLDPRLHTGDVQVQFTGAGEVVVAGYVQAWAFKQPALVVVSPRARTGELELDFVRGKLGRLPAPAWAFDRLGEMASSLILQGRDYAEIANLTVAEGRLTFEAVVAR